MDHFELHSEYKPTGDQPQAIERLVRGFKEGNQFETYWVSPVPARHYHANVIAQLNKPTSSSPTTKLSRRSFTVK